MDLSLSSLWDELDKAGYDEEYEPIDEEPQLRALLVKLRQKSDLEEDSAWLCLRGYICYCLHERQNALRDFRLALQINPDDGWAAMYVAHCLQDDGQYQNALDQANSVELPNQFIKQMMFLKLHEIKLGCRLKLFGSEEVRHDIGAYLEACARHDEPPLNLQRALEALDLSIADWNPPTATVEKEGGYSIFDSFVEMVRKDPERESQK